MSFRKTLARRFLSLSQSSAAAKAPNRTPANAVSKHLAPPDPAEPGFLRRLLPQKRDIFHQSSKPAAKPLGLPVGEKLLDRLRVLNGDRLKLDGLIRPAERRSDSEGGRVTVEDARRLIRAAQVQAARERLSAFPKSCVSYPEFLEICGNCGSMTMEAEKVELAKMLEESGVVLTFGSLVFLQPDQVIKAMEKAIPLALDAPADDPRRAELAKLEEEKAEIDERAEALVRRELYAGLGILAAQTVGFMRLTFWELSWDVMEPICFYVTSLYFMAGYAFFLRTSKEPSFEGFFQSRFAARQRRLMKDRNFDVERFNELCQALALSPEPPTPSYSSLAARTSNVAGTATLHY